VPRYLTPPGVTHTEGGEPRRRPRRRRAGSVVHGLSVVLNHCCSWFGNLHHRMPNGQAVEGLRVSAWQPSIRSAPCPHVQAADLGKAMRAIQHSVSVKRRLLQSTAYRDEDSMRRSMVAAAAVVAVCTVSGATALPGAATAGSAVHTLKFVGNSTAERFIGKNAFAGTDVDRSGGKVVGYDTISGTFHPKNSKIILDLAFALKGGLVVCRIANTGTGPDTVLLKGRIVNGLGRYSGVEGTITFRQFARNKGLVTLRYHF
jgi:hypothetical protein